MDRASQGSVKGECLIDTFYLILVFPWAEITILARWRLARSAFRRSDVREYGRQGK